MITLVVVALVVGALAAANGGNDVSKGIATLVGSGVTDTRRAILWGTLWTAVGGLVASVATSAMVTTFGRGLLTDGVQTTLLAGMATLAGAGAWVLIATRTGLPVSTTHAIVGAVVGVGVVAYGSDGVRWSALVSKVALPLVLAPGVSLLVVLAMLQLARRVAPAPIDPCVCLVEEVTEGRSASAPQASSTSSMAALPGPVLSRRIVVDDAARCDVEAPRTMWTLDHAHWLTAGGASFARGMNDAPKIVALALAATAMQGEVVGRGALFALVTLAMVVGSLVAGRRVTTVLATKVTPLSHHEGFIANLTTAVLVSVGAVFGWPMSTTHVASGGIVGAGLHRGGLYTRTLRDIALAWVVTLPASAALGVCAWGLGSLLGVSS